MKKQWIQSLCIVLVFVLGLGTVIFLGIEQGKRQVIKEGLSLAEKGKWPENPGAPEDPTIVYVTQTGTKYHPDKTCSGLKNAKMIIGIPLSSAEDEGKEPCGLCGK